MLATCFLFFNLSFVALGYNYVPTEELLDKEEEESAAYTDEETENGGLFGKLQWAGCRTYR